MTQYRTHTTSLSEHLGLAKEARARVMMRETPTEEGKSGKNQEILLVDPGREGGGQPLAALGSALVPLVGGGFGGALEGLRDHAPISGGVRGLGGATAGAAAGAGLGALLTPFASGLGAIPGGYLGNIVGAHLATKKYREERPASVKKIAEDTSTDQFMKVAQQIPAVLAETSRHMSKLASRNVELAQENDLLRHELRLHKLAHRMEARGLDQGLTFEDKVAHLQTIPHNKLDAFEQAVELTHGGFKLGSLEEPDTNQSVGVPSELGSAAQYNALDTFITSGRALS